MSVHSRAVRDGAWRRRRLADARLYLCCGADAGAGDLAGFADACLAGGVDIIQLRDKTAGRATLRAAAAVLRSAAAARDALFVVNDDPSLAAEVGADGVHVGQDDAAPEDARRAVGADRIVGLSTHSSAEVDVALNRDVDYLGVGPVHATPTKAGRPGIGLDPVRHAAATSDRPFFVTGGMGLATCGPVVAAGATGIVVVRALVDAEDPRAVAADLRAAIATAGGS